MVTRFPCYHVGMTNTEIVAIIIAKARNAYGHGNAAFDWHVACGNRLSTQFLETAAWLVANPGVNTVDAVEIIDGTYSGADIDRTKELLATLKPELDAYRERCKNRKYTGWSSGNPSQIRYA